MDIAQKRGGARVAGKLVEYIGLANIVPKLKDDLLGEIAHRTVEEYRLDDKSRDKWKTINKDAIDLAMLVAEQKTYPFERAANVKYPLISTAALQFNARAYPAIVPPGDLVKCKVNGKDPTGDKAARAKRVSEYTSWQHTDDMPEWEPDTDRLLIIVPIAGTCFRKRFFDPALGKQVSRLVMADRLIVNNRARSLEDAPRVTEEMHLYPYEIQERIRDGRFAEFDYGAFDPQSADDDDEKQDGDTDKDGPHKFLEQHRRWDLDGDGYPEPYIVTVHEASEKVCRIVANYSLDTVRMTDDGRVAAIRKRDFYIKYGFLPSPDGSFYELGFGWLLKSSNEAINTTLNEMLDAGHLANVQGGFVSSALGLREKEFKIKMGHWKTINYAGNISQAVMPITYPGPSDTLFKLLGLLVEMGKEVASIKDVLSGEVKMNMQPTTVLALIDQGLQFFTAIYKRIHRSLKAELVIHNRLNKEHLDAESYNAFFDDQEQQFDPKADFDDTDMDISPASDPSKSSKMQKLAQAEFLQTWAKDNPVANSIEVNRRVLEAAQIEDIDKLIQMPEPDPLAKMLGELEAQEKMAGITELMTKALKNIADAEAAEEGSQLGMYDMVLKALQSEIGAANGVQDGQGRLPAMEGQPGDAMGALLPSGAGGDDRGVDEGTFVPVNAGEPGGMGSPPA